MGERTPAASVYRFQDRYVVAAEIGGGGYWQASDYAVALDVGCGDEELGAALVGALEESVVREPQENRRGLMRHILRAGKVRSQRELMAQAKLCHAFGGRDGIELLPTRNGGASGPQRGYTPLEEAVIRCAADLDAAVLGQLLREAIDACE